MIIIIAAGALAWAHVFLKATENFGTFDGSDQDTGYSRSSQSATIFYKEKTLSNQRFEALKESIMASRTLNFIFQDDISVLL